MLSIGTVIVPAREGYRIVIDSMTPLTYHYQPADLLAHIADDIERARPPAPVDEPSTSPNQDMFDRIERRAARIERRSHIDRRDL